MLLNTQIMRLLAFLVTCGAFLPELAFADTPDNDDHAPAAFTALDGTAFDTPTLMDDDEFDLGSQTLGPVTVMFFTWNQEYCQDAALADLVNVEMVERHRPDLIVIATQEALRAPASAPRYLYERLPEVLTNYESVPGGFATIPGHTKGTLLTFARGTLGSQATRQGWNYLSIELLKRRDSPYAGQDLSISTSIAKESTSGKGAALATLTIGGKTIAIAAAHLDAASDQVRNSNIVHILRQAAFGSRGLLAGLASAVKKVADKISEITDGFDAAYHAVFMLGDLNYRLNPSTEIPLTTNVAAMSGHLAGPTQWASLSTLDSMKSSPLVADFGFQCNDISSIPPTYKRDYAVGAAACNEFARTPSAANAAGCYFAGMKPTEPLATKHKQFQLGWLDRVCWRPRSRVTVTQLAVSDARGVTCSDHVPSSTVVVIDNAR